MNKVIQLVSGKSKLKSVSPDTKSSTFDTLSGYFVGFLDQSKKMKGMMCSYLNPQKDNAGRTKILIVKISVYSV